MSKGLNEIELNMNTVAPANMFEQDSYKCHSLKWFNLIIIPFHFRASGNQLHSQTVILEAADWVAAGDQL
jgi:hypothetical protein